MKVYVVIECGHYNLNDLACNALGVHTSLEKAKKEMLDCHNNMISIVETLWDYNDNATIISQEVDEMECTLLYQTGGYLEEHLVVIEEREVEV